MLVEATNGILVETAREVILVGCYAGVLGTLNDVVLGAVERVGYTGFLKVSLDNLQTGFTMRATDKLC